MDAGWYRFEVLMMLATNIEIACPRSSTRIRFNLSALQLIHLDALGLNPELIQSRCGEYCKEQGRQYNSESNSIKQQSLCVNSTSMTGDT